MSQQTAAVTFTLTIQSPLTITSPLPPAGTVGLAYSHQFTAANGVAPYAWSVASGSLPAGLTLSASGLLSGTPAAAGSYAVTIAVTDAG